MSHRKETADTADLEVGVNTSKDLHHLNYLIKNPTYMYLEEMEKVHGFLSKQFPTVANPAPLGLCGFALTAFVLSMMNAGGLRSIWSSSNGVVMGLVLFYGGVCQFLAGMWMFETGNTFGALTFGSYGCFWMSFAALFIDAFGFLNGYTNETDLNNDLGIYFLAWTIFSIWMTIASHRTTVAFTIILFLVVLTFLMLSIHFFTGSINCQIAAGCFGIMVAFLAWYCAYAGFLSKDNSFFVLPVGEWDPIYRSWGWLPAEEEEEDK